MHPSTPDHAAAPDEPVHITTVHDAGVGFAHGGRRHGAQLGVSHVACTCGVLKQFPGDDSTAMARQWARAHERGQGRDIRAALVGDLQEDPRPPSVARRRLGAPALDAAAGPRSFDAIVTPDHGDPGDDPWWLAMTAERRPVELGSLVGAMGTVWVIGGWAAAEQNLGVVAVAWVIALWLTSSVVYLLTHPRSEGP